MARRKTKTLQVMTVRLHPKIHEKLGWLATERNETIADTMRSILTTATRSVLPPKQLKSREIVSSEAQWESWQKVATSMNTTTDALVARLMDSLATRAGFPPHSNEAT